MIVKHISLETSVHMKRIVKHIPQAKEMMSMQESLYDKCTCLNCWRVSEASETLSRSVQ